MFGGLWSEWRVPGRDEIMLSATIVTYASPPDVATIHERTPLVVKPEYWNRWLDTETQDANQVERLVQDAAIRTFTLSPIGTAVSKIINRGPECLEPRTWPELEEQRTARYSEEQLVELRECGYESLVSRLRDNTIANQAEWRLWIRELADRDDANQFEGFISELRYGLKLGTQPQAGLF